MQDLIPCTARMPVAVPQEASQFILLVGTNYCAVTETKYNLVMFNRAKLFSK